MENILSEGECLYCNKKFKKAGISRHLNTHLNKKVINAKPGQSFHIRIEEDPRWGSAPYFLNLWMDGDALMEDLDYFLRKIWLECCGHMSAFTKPQKREQQHIGWDWDPMEAFEKLQEGEIGEEEYEQMREDALGEVPLSREAKEVFSKGLKLKYEYDFGSTTALQLTVIETFPVKAEKNMVLLSRNEPPALMCDLCHKKPATHICTACNYHDDSYFCDSCARKHAKECDDFADYADMPIVNSPRMGVCGYTGGDIDKERDRLLN